MIRYNVWLWLSCLLKKKKSHVQQVYLSIMFDNRTTAGGCGTLRQAEWSALSLDLNSIERPDHQMRVVTLHPRSSVFWGQHFKKIGNHDSADNTVSGLVRSNRHRCQTVIDAQGHASYWDIGIFCCGVLLTVVGFCFSKMASLRWRNDLHMLLLKFMNFSHFPYISPKTWISLTVWEQCI